MQKLDNSDFPVDDNAAKKIANKIHAEFSLIEVDPLAHKIYCPGRKTDFTTFLGEYKRQIDPEPRKNPIKEYIIVKNKFSKIKKKSFTLKIFIPVIINVIENR